MRGLTSKILLKRLVRVGLVRPIWLVNYYLSRAWWILTSGRKRNQHFKQHWYLIDRFSEDEIRPLMDAIRTSTRCPEFSDRPAFWYEYDDSGGQRDQNYNQGRYFFKMDEVLLVHCDRLVERLLSNVTTASGCHLRVVNTNIWVETESDKPSGDREWHCDRFARGALKILVYLSGASREVGTTEVAPKGKSRMVAEGPPGTWMFFENNRLWHRAIVARQGDRYVLQITLSPAFKSDPITRTQAPDAHYPKLPWMPARRR
jgi:hypothetical protein